VQLRPSLVVRLSISLNTILCIVFNVYIHLTILIPRNDFFNILLVDLRSRLGLDLVSMSLRGLHALQRFSENSARLILDRRKSLALIDLRGVLSTRMLPELKAVTLCVEERLASIVHD